jgi:WD40-like Beta Propeller Repeat
VRGIRIVSPGMLKRALACFVALMVAAPAANAAFPGANGKIAFEQHSSTAAERGIWVMNADGTNRVPLTTSTAGADLSPAWSADGKQIAFVRDRAIWVMNADGTGQRQVVPATPETQCAFPPCNMLGNPAWSPDASKLAFDDYRQVDVDPVYSPEFFDLYTVNVDGTGEALLVRQGKSPRWSPDGTKIGFTFFRYGDTDLEWITPDGNSARRVSTTLYDSFRDWSPDGSRMAATSELTFPYTIHPDGTGKADLHNVIPEAWSPDGTKFAWGTGDIYTANVDGTGRTNLTNNAPNSVSDTNPDWQPIPNRPPDCSSVTASRPVLTTANRKLVAIALDGATDPDGDPVSLSVDGVTQDEPVVSSGDHTAPDAIDAGEGELRVRAERNPHGDGRVYQIAFTASDGHGGSCSGTAVVSVPRKKRKPAVDSAPPSYDSLVH